MREIALSKCAHLTMALVAALAGCGGGGGGDAANSPNPPAPTGPIEVAVTVIDPSSANGYAAAAAVCLDQDASLTCDATELAGVADAAGKLKLTVAVADQPRLSGGQWLARLTTTFSNSSGRTVTGEVLQVARAGGVAQTQVVVSPLTTWIEQLVLATMSRGDAEAAVREQAGLTTLNPATDFVAAEAGPQAAEAQGARAAARSALAYQTPDMMAVLKAPAPEYPQALAGAGVHRVLLSESGFGPGDYEGRLNSTRLVQPPGVAASQVEVVLRTFRRDSGQWSAPTLAGADGPLTGPVLEADGRWTTAIPEVSRVAEGARSYVAYDGQRRFVEMRDAIAMDGQAIDLSHFGSPGGDAPVPGGQRFPTGSRHFKNVVFVVLTSHALADVLFERLDPNGQPLPGPAHFSSYEDFVAQYPTTGGVWFQLPLAFGEELSFDADGAPRFRMVDPFDPSLSVDHGVGRHETLQFSGVTIHRIHVPEAARLNAGSTIDLVVHAGGLRPIYISRRGTISGGATRAFNATATEAMLAHVLWPLPPGGL